MTTSTRRLSADAGESFASLIAHLLHVLWLFTKSDITTVLVPVSAFACALCRPCSLPQVPIVVVWIWLHLLQFCVANQINGMVEDRVDKPWRPIASGALSSATAYKLRWVLVPVCLLASARTAGTLIASAGLTIVVALHNEIALDRHWAGKNICCALGYAFFELGAVCTANGRDHLPMADQFASITHSSLIILTTIHAQDFRDINGDRRSGRTTLPLLIPQISRQSLLPLLMTWSIYLARAYTSYTLSVFVLFFSVIVGFRFSWHSTIHADRMSYTLYNVWLLLTHIAIGSSVS